MTTRDSPSEATIDRLSTPIAVFLFWAGFSVIFAAIQLLSSSTLTLDSAVTVENVQRHLSGGYQLRNPPLFDWLYYFAQFVLGEGILAHTVLRYVFFTAIGVLHYFAFLQVGCGRRLAAAFSYSLLFFVWMASDFHYHFTHSLPLFAIGLAAWVTAIAYVERPTAARAALLGLLVGFGMIAKWSFLLPAAGVFCAFMFDARARAALVNRRSLLIPLIAVIPLMPVALWAHRIGGNVFAVVHHRLIGDSAPYLARVVPAVWSYLTSIVLYILPWPIFIGVIGYVARKRDGAASVMHPNGRLAVSATLWTVGLGLAGVIAIGVTNMGTRYMFPVLLTAPIAMAAWIATRVDEMPFVRTTINVATIVAIVAIVIRFWSFQIIDSVMPENRGQRIPYQELADALVARGLGEAQFVVDSDRDAGNLMAHLPDARALATNTQRVEPPLPDTVGERTCVAIWGGNNTRLPERPSPRPPPRFVAQFIEAGAGPVEDIYVDWPNPLYGYDRQSIWRVVELPPEADICRTARGLLREP